MFRSRCFSSWLLIALALLSLTLLCLAREALAAEPPPNILFILTDDQRYDDIEHMPILQRELVGHGMLFERYFSNVSLCCPSRMSILRGQYAHNTGVLTNNEPNGGFGVAHTLGAENSTIGVWLHEHGYRTALIGKYLNGYPGNLGASYIPPGWDFWASSSIGNPYSEYNYTLNENGKLVQYGNSPEDYGTDVYTRKATEFIKSCSSERKPFFMYLAFYAPHAPATPAPRHMGLFKDAKIPRTPAFNQADVSKMPQYIQNLPPLSNQEIASADFYYGKRLRSLQAVDEAIETLCKTLAETNQLNNTYIVFAADNGYHLGQHRMRRGKMTAYDTDIHLPLIVRGPGVAAGVKAEALVGNIDLAPTFADLAGAKAPDFVDGRSMTPLLHGTGKTAKARTWREEFLVEHWQAGAGGRKRRAAGGQRISEAKCQHSPHCALQCAHLADCYCCDANSSNASMADHLDEQKYKSSEPRFELASYSEQERTELAQENADEESVQTTERAPEDLSTEPGQGGGQADTAAVGQPDVAAPKKRRPGGRRRSFGGAGGAPEFGPIPEYKAIRAPENTYVEYVTGEREFYRLIEDPFEVNNMTGDSGVKGLEEKFSQAIRRLSNHPASTVDQRRSE